MCRSRAAQEQLPKVSFKRFRSEATSYFVVRVNNKVTQKMPFILKHHSFELSEGIMGLKGTRSAQTTFILNHYFLRYVLILNGLEFRETVMKKCVKVGGVFFNIEKAPSSRGRHMDVPLELCRRFRNYPIVIWLKSAIMRASGFNLNNFQPM